jgi:membrane-bound ClpP family serine protease
MRAGRIGAPFAQCVDYFYNFGRVKGLLQKMILNRVHRSTFAQNRAVVGLALLAAILSGQQLALGQEENKPADAGAANAAATKVADDEIKPAEPAPPQAADQESKPEAPANDLGDGRLIRVRLPLTGNADAHIKTSIQRAVRQLTHSPPREQPAPGTRRRPVLIFELSAKGGPAGFGEGTDFTRALSLADYLVGPELAGIKTVAYIPRTIKGHGVLVALACEEIAMHPDAEIGEAGIDEDATRPIKPNIVRMYQHIAAARDSVPNAIALGMLDPSVEVLMVETDEATEFILGDELEEIKRKHTLVSPEETIVPRGSMGSFTGRLGSKYSFVRLLANDREALARGLTVKPNAVIEDQSLLGDWKPVMISVEGPVTPRKARQLDTLITTETRDRNANWLGIRIDSTGGQLIDCLRVADRIAGLDSDDVQTVAYVPMDASGGAALIALACDQVVMQPEAHVGGKGTIELDRAELDAAVQSIRASLATNSRLGWSLLAATIDPDIELFSYRNTKTGDVRYFSSEEADEQPVAADWQKGPRIKQAGEPLRLDSKRAQELGAATHVVDSFDEFKQLYGFREDPRTAEPNWALELIEALSSPGLAFVLLVIGFVGIYVELHTPGVGAGAFVAALAFMLFFWSNFLNGTAGWLEVLLFVGGLMFLLVEMLILPGFGIFGLGGGLMILSSLVLASQTFVLPQSDSELKELRYSLTIVAAATLCVVIAAIALRRYLPRAPMFRTLLLNPAPEEELIELDYRESLADFSHLIGQQGTATTNLMPAGKADFEGQLVDVIAEGLPIERGQAIVVTKARGNRVLVRAVDS